MNRPGVGDGAAQECNKTSRGKLGGNRASGRAPAPIKKSFRDYVHSAEFGRRWCWPGNASDAFRARLAREEIGSLRALQNWFRQRYPKQYYGRSLLSFGKTGKEIVRELWAAYLEWAGL